MRSDPVSIQRKYYEDTASAYDQMHLFKKDEHYMALSWLAALIKLHEFNSLLDVGCGTGRGVNFLKNQGIPIKMVGIEPVAALREAGIKAGLNPSEIVGGDALALPFADKSFDVVCAFAILHHIKDHKSAVAEMCRVARKAVFISDSNNFGQGGRLARAVKQFLRSLRLWSVYDFIRTRGKGYQISAGDGLFYSYTLENDIPVLRTRFPNLYFMSTQPSGTNLFRSAGHFAVFAQG
jgi:ubiquinone/menaquinone biosynthesis C-methylase UbiE